MNTGLELPPEDFDELLPSVEDDGDDSDFEFELD